MKLIKVYSHPRSGTHYLCSFLKRNFYPELDLSIGPYEWGHWSSREVNDSGSPFGKLTGTHQYLSGVNVKQLGPSIYIYRDGRSIALSLWRTKNFLNHLTRPNTFSEFLRMKLDWIGTPGIRHQPDRNIAQHWCQHLHGWHESTPTAVLLLRYENLLADPESAYVEIRNKFFPLRRVKEMMKKHEIILEKNTVGIAPESTSRECSWEHFYNEEDVAFFYDQVCGYCRGILNRYAF